MKKIYLNTLTILVFLLTYSSISAQITTPTSIYERGEYMGLVNDKLLLEDLKIYAGTSDGDWLSWGNITFGGGLNHALASHELIETAKERAFNLWLDKQKNLIKEEIEKRLNQNFSSFNDAQESYFKDLEFKNISSVINTPIKKYNSIVDLKAINRNSSIRNLKLLQFRENEIKSGNITNSNYSNLKINDTPINQINTLSQIKALKNSEIEIFGAYDCVYKNEVFTLNKLYEISNIRNNIHHILDLLYDLQMTNYNKLNAFEKLDLMQLYLNGVRIPMVIINTIKPYDFGTSNFVENYAKNHYRGPQSPFDANCCPPIKRVVGRGVTIEVPNTSCLASIEITKQEVLDEALGSISNDAFLATNAIIRDLNYDINSSEAKWLSSHINESINIHNFLLTNKIGNIIPSNVIKFTKESIKILDSNLSNSEQLNQFLVVHENFDPTLTNNLPKEEYEARIKHYIKSFNEWGNKEFANYLQSLLPLDGAFSNNDYHQLYITIKNKKAGLLWDYIGAIFGQTVDSFKPLIEVALWELGSFAALKILQKLPIKYITTPIKNVINRLKVPTSTAFSKLKHAKKYGIQGYKNLKTTFDDLGLSLKKEGLERHHLIEKRFAEKNPNIAQKLFDKFGKTTDDWLSIIVEKGKKGSEHDIFSQAWKEAIGQNGKNGAPGMPGWTGKTTSTATFDDVIKAAKEIYKDYPEILKALGI